MNVYEVLFLLQFLMVIGVLVLKTVNVCSLGTFLSLKYVFLSFVGYFLGWFIALVVMLANPETIVYIVFFKLESGLILLVVAFFVAELFLSMKNTVLRKPVVAYSARDQRV